MYFDIFCISCYISLVYYNYDIAPFTKYFFERQSTCLTFILHLYESILQIKIKLNYSGSAQVFFYCGYRRDGGYLHQSLLNVLFDSSKLCLWCDLSGLLFVKWTILFMEAIYCFYNSTLFQINQLFKFVRTKEWRQCTCTHLFLPTSRTRRVLRASSPAMRSSWLSYKSRNTSLDSPIVEILSSRVMRLCCSDNSFTCASAASTGSDVSPLLHSNCIER